jgi:hypothetical protein
MQHAVQKIRGGEASSKGMRQYGQTGSAINSSAFRESETHTAQSE